MLSDNSREATSVTRSTLPRCSFLVVEVFTIIFDSRMKFTLTAVLEGGRLGTLVTQQSPEVCVHTPTFSLYTKRGK